MYLEVVGGKEVLTGRADGEIVELAVLISVDLVMRDLW